MTDIPVTVKQAGNTTIRGKIGGENLRISMRTAARAASRPSIARRSPFPGTSREMRSDLSPSGSTSTKPSTEKGGRRSTCAPRNQEIDSERHLMNLGFKETAQRALTGRIGQKGDEEGLNPIDKWVIGVRCMLVSSYTRIQ